MNSATRPKPWESQVIHEENNSVTDHNSTGNTNTTSSNNNSSLVSPEVPPLPIDTNDSQVDTNNQQYGVGPSLYGGGAYGDVNPASGLYGNGFYGNGPYGNSGLYGNAGLYGNNGMYGYGLYGNSGYGYGYGYGRGATGTAAGMNGPGIITESTMATFQLLENLIGAINGFAQILESSYMATYNSFFTLVSFAEEISRLKEFLGSIFGMFNLIKMFKKLLIHFKPRSIHQTNETNSLVEEFQNTVKIRNGNNGKENRARNRRLAWKPLILFFMAVFGFPYLLQKYINRLQNSHIKQLLSKGLMDEPIDLTSLDFARALYDFIPENPTIELTLKKGDLMAIISKKDPNGKESLWWRVRTKKGDVGYVPSNYIEIIKRR